MQQKPKSTALATEKDIKSSLATLGLKPLAQEVFIYLSKNGLSPANDIAFALSIPKSSVYDALSQLLDQSLISEYNEDKNKTFEAIGSDGLKQIIAQKVEQIQKAGNSLLEFASSQKPDHSPAKPRIKFYFGEEGIRQAFRDTAWNDHCKKSYVMWPTKEMLDVLTPEFSAWHSAQRLKHNIHLYAIRTHADRSLDKSVTHIKSPSMKTLLESPGWATNREIRYMPKGMPLDMSFWVYDNKCICASGGSEKYAFIVHSREFADLMTLLWKQVWNVCEK
jgi:sugar-specific transcriptional regulator TrmB